MKVLLLNLPRVHGYPVVREERYEHRDIGAVYPPLSLLHTATSLLEKGHDVRLLDSNGFDLSLRNTAILISEFNPDIIFARLGFDTLQEDLKALEKLRSRLNIPIVVRNRIASGHEPTRSIILDSPGVDAFLNSPPEGALAQFLDLHGSRPVRGTIYPDAGECSQFQPPLFPAYHLLPSLEPYHTGVSCGTFAMISTSTGCPFKCTFCAYNGTSVTFKEPGQVVDEMEYLVNERGVSTILFFDDLVLLREGRMEAICNEIIGRGIKVKWIACTRANLVRDESIALMKRAGLVEMAIGIESGDPGILESIGKGITVDHVRDACRIIKSHGVLCYGMVILGLPGETRESFEKTMSLVLECDPFYVQFCFSIPFPNTSIYSWYRERNYLFAEKCSDYWPLSDTPMVRTEALGREDLKSMRREAYRRFVMRPSYLFRKIRLDDPMWTFRAGFRLAERIFRMISGDPVR
ncbi:MAG: hypothetical protein CVV64_09075 [Candidatus Wallbacteria bacterium HGW-Wallbacteria-1]|jgi:radical SAM superfamily enzyme YgiQ (UPF0313 family)|uniref:Radical SAM core domain-containing protein n=1 Tax=Candidatus Wallbacteria bacterium HGW-Wallbacteria-1 TaxID=2013854 RepID=A0A2N1PQ92_9BACT|nr:MAG: hypothetical protein CVV64_09075 [Candidatus Wallbacteria bacterium HGW-Wallbacteria-1]